LEQAQQKYYQHWLLCTSETIRVSMHHLGRSTNHYLAIGLGVPILPLAFATIITANMSGSRFLALLKLLPYLTLVDIVFFSQVVGYNIEVAVFGYPLSYRNSKENEELATVACFLAAIYLLMEVCVNVNESSLHGVYKRRLFEAYLLRKMNSDKAEITRGEQEMALLGDLKLSDLSRVNHHAPYLIINASVDIQDKAKRGDGTLIDRTVDFVTLSKRFVGSRRLGYTSTPYMEEAMPDLDLATATAISGAAIGQAVVHQRHGTVEFIMALFNLRMGYWMVNPSYIRWCRRQRHNASRVARMTSAVVQAYSGTFLYFKELMGLTSAASAHIHLTDGGHIEDLGLYELLHRRCKYIIVCDASSEDEGPYHYRFNRLATATRLARINQGVEITLDLTKLQPNASTGYTKRHYTVGLINYPGRPALGQPQERG